MSYIWLYLLVAKRLVAARSQMGHTRPLSSADAALGTCEAQSGICSAAGNTRKIRLGVPT